jgi:hypothetical protein
LFFFYLLFRTPVLQAELLEGQFQSAAQIGAYVLDPTSKVVYQKQSSMEGHWAFTSPADGSYKVCISNPNSKLKQSVGILWTYKIEIFNAIVMSHDIYLYSIGQQRCMITLLIELFCFCFFSVTLRLFLLASIQVKLSM